MKTNLFKLLLLVAGAASITAASAGEVREIPRILTEGKSWIIADVERRMSGAGMEKFTIMSRIAVERDSVIDGKVFKVMSKCPVDAEEMKTWTLAYEENGVLYSGFFNSDLEASGGMYKMLDMSLDEGESTDVIYSSVGSEDGKVVGSLEVTKVNTVTVNGKEVRELITNYSSSGTTCTNSYVEGVGAAREEWLTAFPVPTTLSGKVYSYMIACYQGDECIFTADDFTIPGKMAQPTAPLLTEGKSWLIGVVNYNYNTPGATYTSLMKMEVCGDTIVGGKSCKRLVSYPANNDSRKSYTIAYEENGKIFGCYDNGNDEPRFYPMLDMSLTKGESVNLTESGLFELDDKFIVKSENTLNVNGTQRRELVMFREGTNYPVTSWVEGVGASIDNWLTLFPQPTSMTGVAHSFMIECYQDGECIFRQEDFTNPVQSGPRAAKLLTNGKSWLIERNFSVNGETVTRRYDFEVCGDTLADNIACKRICCKSVDDAAAKTYYFAAIEEDGRIYCYKHAPAGDDGMIMVPLMDFNVQEKSNVYIWPEGDDQYYDEIYSLYVKEMNILNVRGVERKELVLTFNTDHNKVVTSWVEGIGCSSGVWITEFPMVDCREYPCSEIRLIECRQDGEVIFTADDFSYPLASIRNLTADAAESGGAVYDLLGRRVANPAPGSIYIKNGRKYLTR